MKKTLIYVALIAAGIAVSCQTKPSETSVVSADSFGEITIAMIDTDSIFTYYDMADDMRRELEAVEKRLTDDLQRQVRNLQSEGQKLGTDVENYKQIGHTLTLSEQRQRETQFNNRDEQLQRRQVEIQQLEQRYMQQLMELRAQKNQELEDKIFSFIETYNKANGNFSIIMSKARSSGTLYSLPSMDITAPVLEAMNAEYKTIRKK
ncbi:MAG: OmpH family outer membrane protein [Bacteroidales bacterium]|nr:OmpH family outer membrane protein [Bacteroidales bacterium]